MFIRAYLRASTSEQNAARALQALEQFASAHGQVIASTYIENISGTKVERPELTRLLKDARQGDVLLLESIDRLSRLSEADWRALKSMIDDQGIRIVALDLPTSHIGLKHLSQTAEDEFTGRMLGAINTLMIEMMAAIARKDYEQRRQRQRQGIAKAQANGGYQGRQVDHELHRRILELLDKGFGVRATARHAQCSPTTVMKVRDEAEQALEG